MPIRRELASWSCYDRDPATEATRTPVNRRTSHQVTGVAVLATPKDPLPHSWHPHLWKHRRVGRRVTNLCSKQSARTRRPSRLIPQLAPPISPPSPAMTSMVGVDPLTPRPSGVRQPSLTPMQPLGCFGGKRRAAESTSRLSTGFDIGYLCSDAGSALHRSAKAGLPVSLTRLRHPHLS